MSSKKQFEKNVKLSEDVANYLVDNPDYLIKYGNSSFIVFTKSDKDLNNMNQDLLLDLLDEGKKVVVVTQTSKKSNPWKFEFAN